jgi:hypothetical protein
VTTEVPRLPRHGGERELLEGFLDWYRAAVLRTADGLGIEALERRLVPSATTMAGVVRHLAYVEMWWFQAVLHDREIDFPWTDEDPDAEFRPRAGETPDDLRALYEKACAQSRDAIAGLDLDHRSAGQGRDRSLRWILLHMVEETARHAGHLDILRELTDGSVGE